MRRWRLFLKNFFIAKTPDSEFHAARLWTNSSRHHNADSVLRMKNSN